MWEGWSDKMVEGPRSFEKPHGKAGEDYVLANLRLIENSNGLLPSQLGSDMRTFTVACTHTGFVPKVINSVPPCDGLHPELCTEDMKIDKDKILRTCPSLRKPCEKGIKYVVFKAVLEAACPALPTFFADAGNMGHGVHRKRTTVQTLLAINTKLQSWPCTPSQA